MDELQTAFLYIIVDESNSFERAHDEKGVRHEGQSLDKGSNVPAFTVGSCARLTSRGRKVGLTGDSDAPQA